MIVALGYRITIAPLSAADGGGYTAVAPGLPGCRSDGDTPRETLGNIYDAIGCWVEAAGEMGQPIPRPRRPMVAEDGSFEGKGL